MGRYSSFLKVHVNTQKQASRAQSKFQAAASRPPNNETSHFVIGYKANPKDEDDYLIAMAVIDNAPIEIIDQNINKTRRWCVEAEIARRAAFTVRESITYRGKAVKPEAYVSLWDAAIKQPYNIGELTKLYGHTLFADITGPAEGLRNCKPSSTTTTHGSFSELMRVHGLAISLDQPIFSASIPVLTEDALRHFTAVRDLISWPLNMEVICTWRLEKTTTAAQLPPHPDAPAGRWRFIESDQSCLQA